MVAIIRDKSFWRFHRKSFAHSDADDDSYTRE
jgi:hypothetical protein